MGLLFIAHVYAGCVRVAGGWAITLIVQRNLSLSKTQTGQVCG